MQNFSNYITELQNQSLSEITEHSHRSHLENLINTILKDLSNTETKVLHEPRRQGRNGSPDFMIYSPSGIIGYIENKKITQNLDEIIESDQIRKYMKLSDNILITNYIEFVWLRGSEVFREKLCDIYDLKNKNFTLNKENETQVYNLLRNFLIQAPKGIYDAQTLAFSLAERARYLYEILVEYLYQQKDNEEIRDEIWGTYESFVDTIYEDLTIEGFTDTFAQTLAYGLFLAKLNLKNEDRISLRNIDLHIPDSFSLIKNIVSFLKYINKERYSKALWIVEELLSIINNIDLASIQDDLNFSKTRKKEDVEFKDPFIYFYENFLSEYNPSLRKSRGVYYTPHSVVKFIISSIDDVLKDEEIFNFKNGIADHENVTFLDFATGTGTFLLEILEQINAKFPFNKPEGNQLIKKHINNLFGFEFLISPYVISHLKLSQFLKENGFDEFERLNIYLTNTLEDKEPQRSLFVPELSSEGKLAKNVKRDQKILVITGNPPYSGHSSNAHIQFQTETKTFKSGKSKRINRKYDTWIGKLIKEYYQIEKVPISETNSKWLQDDYVKFIRFAQYKIDQSKEGIVAIITNHSFLDNPTFRAMRYSLMKSFDQIHIIDLHGNSKRKEETSDGSKDENVFDIQQGVCISIMIKKQGLKKIVRKADFWGDRDTKINLLLSSNLNKIQWQLIKPSEPFYLFSHQDSKLKKVYEKWISINDIFQKSSIGIVTARDKLTIQFKEKDIKKIVNDFVKLPTEEARDKYQLGKDARDWSIEMAKNDLKLSGLKNDNFNKILYRPFDIRYTYYTGNSRGFQCMPRREIMSNFNQKNFALITSRIVKGNSFNHVFVTQKISDGALLATNTASSSKVFPLFIFKEKSIPKLNNNYLSEPEIPYTSHESEKNIQEKFENFKPKFRKSINSKYKMVFTPEQIFSYIYGILHSSTYRKKYSDFLKIDFPRIPLLDDIDLFTKISELGQELINAHLMDIIPQNDIGEKYDGEVGCDNIEQVEFRMVNNIGRVYINKTNFFEPIPKEVYEFYIGGYKVIEKYLKERKGRNLDIDEIDNIKNISKIIAYTIKKMNEIDLILSPII